jgi:hypothetical protein
MDLYKGMFRITAGTTFTILGSQGIGSFSGNTLPACTGLLPTADTSASLKFFGGEDWLTGVTLNKGVVYPFKLAGVKINATSFGLN